MSRTRTIDGELTNLATGEAFCFEWTDGNEWESEVFYARDENNRRIRMDRDEVIEVVGENALEDWFYDAPWLNNVGI